MSHNVIFVGYRTCLRDELTAKNRVQPPTPPKRMSRPESIQKWKQEEYPLLLAEQERRLSFLKATGALEEVYAVDLAGGRVFSSAEMLGPDEDIAVSFARWLVSAYSFRDRFQSPEIFGIDPKPLMRLTGINSERGGYHVPRYLWYQGTDSNCFDPFQMLLETEAKNMIPIQKICEEAPGGPIEIPADYTPHQDPKLDAVLAGKLVFAYGLFCVPIGENGEELHATVFAEIVANYPPDEEEEGDSNEEGRVSISPDNGKLGVDSVHARK